MRASPWLAAQVMLDVFTIDGRFGNLPKDSHELDVRKAEDDALASKMLAHALHMAFFRHTRSLWLLRGWPSMSVLMLHEDASVRASAVQQLRDDLGSFRQLQVEVDAGASPAFLLARHIFHLKPVQQLVQALEAREWVLDSSILLWLSRFHRRLIGSQIAEDGLRECRQVESNALSKRAPAKTLYYRLAQSRVIDERHRFTAPRTLGRRPCRDAHMPDDAFRASSRSSSMSFGEIKGASAKTPWYSPSAQRWSVAYGDLSLLQLQRQPGGEHLGLADAWQGLLLSGSDFLVRKQGGGGEFMYPLGHIEGSISLAWPASSERIGESQAWQPASPGKVVHLAVCDWHEWEAIPIKAVSPLSQLAAWPVTHKAPHQCLLVRCVLDQTVASGPLPLLSLAARHAFWELPLVSLKRIARQLNISDVDQRSSLFVTLWHLVSAILDTDAEATLAILQKRLARVSNDHAVSKALMELDEGFDLMDSKEADAMKAEKKQLKAKQPLDADFRKDYVAKAVVLRQRAADSSRGRKRKTDPSARVPDGDISQQSAKLLLPPNCSLWRNRMQGGWCAHLTGYARMSRQWATHGGERESLLSLLRALWDLHLEREGLGHSACTVQGLFADASPAPRVEARAGAASSNSVGSKPAAAKRSRG